MGEIIKRFQDGSFLEYDQGGFDCWCVYFTDSSGVRRPPTDSDYFFELKQLAGKYGAGRVYKDYVRIYDMTGKEADSRVLESISRISESYGSNALQADVIFSVLYMTMIAEERKAHTKLGKRIKRLGVYQLLIENKSISEAANFTRGMDWRSISKLCKERGF